MPSFSWLFRVLKAPRGSCWWWFSQADPGVQVVGEAGPQHPHLQTDSRGLQKLSFNPNWICREVVTVLRMAPALLLGLPHVCPIGQVLPVWSIKGNRAVRFAELGTPKFGWLKMLNISARKSSALPSANANSLKREKSQFIIFGPISVFLPRFPTVLAGCSTNPFGSNQGLGPPVNGLLEKPRRTSRSPSTDKPILSNFHLSSLPS